MWVDYKREKGNQPLPHAPDADGARLLEILKVAQNSTLIRQNLFGNRRSKPAGGSR